VTSVPPSPARYLFGQSGDLHSAQRGLAADPKLARGGGDATLGLSFPGATASREFRDRLSRNSIRPRTGCGSGRTLRRTYDWEAARLEAFRRIDIDGVPQSFGGLTATSRLGSPSAAAGCRTRER